MDWNTQLPTRNIADGVVKFQQLPPTAEPVYDLPHLPLELWSHVLRNVDDPLTLWVTCRHVSRIFKLEAERAFRLVMLPHLQMSWCFGDPDWGNRFEVVAAPDASLKLPYYEDNAQIAAFTLSNKGPFYAHAEDQRPFPSLNRAQGVKDALEYGDTKLQHRDELTYGARMTYHALSVSFANCRTPENCHINDLELDPIYLVIDAESSGAGESQPTHAGTLFLNWHAPLNAFFTEIVAVRTHVDAPKVNFSALLANAKEYITSRCPYLTPQDTSSTPLSGIISDDSIVVDARTKFHEEVRTAYNANAADEDSLYWEAYKYRIERADVQNGPRLVMGGGDYEQKLKDHVERLREARIFMVQTYAQELWDSEFGAIEFEYEYEEGEVGFLERDFD